MVAIFVAFMFVSLVLTDLAVTKWREWRVARAVQTVSPAAVGDRADAWRQVPEGVHIVDQHTWIKPDPTGGLGIGADAFLVRAVGAAGRIVLPTVGEQVSAGQPLFRLEQNGRSLMIPSALTGRIMAVNTRLENEPELLTSDPYGSGWICYLNPTRVEGAAPRAHFGEQATRWLEDEFALFRDFVLQFSPDVAFGMTSQDGGLPAFGCLGELGQPAWSAFETSFIRRP
jgi:glycine cleavage system H protein